jgi:Putative phage tail protein
MSALAGTGATNAPINYTGLNVGSSMWNAPVAIFWGRRRLSTNAIWYGAFTSKPAAGKGKGAGGKDQQQTYFAAVILALCEGPLDDPDGITNIWPSGSTTTVTTLSNLNMASFLGTRTQAPWSFVVTNAPSQALAYAETAGLVCPKLALGESAQIPDNGFECIRTLDFAYTQASGGWINPNTHEQSPGLDCLMSDIIADLLTNTQYGMGFSSSDLASITQYATYQQAQGLAFSPLLVSQEKATSIIDRWAQLSNAWIYWSGTQLQFVPLGDSVVTGNGVTYTPVQDVAYDLCLADFIKPSGKDDGPVKVTRLDPADAHNRTVLDFTDRTLGYIDNPVEFKDQTLVDQFGLRDDSSTEADEICSPAVAAITVQLIGKRNAYIRNSYAFKTSYRFILCLPGTILTLTEPNIGLDRVRVRVKTISEDDKDQLSFVCEEFPGNVGSYYPPVAASTINTATTPDLLVLPGNVNTPAIVEPDSAFTGGTPKIIIAASGGANWGGCGVYVSFDGLAYGSIGTITASAVQGALTANLAAYPGANPDTVDTLAVDCTESLSAPSTVTNADATALRTLSLVAAQPTLSGEAYIVPTDGELLAFGDVAATGTYTANLTFLERGAYGTRAGAHNIGDQFTLIDVTGTDGTSVAYDLPAQYIGQTIFLKLASFNVFDQSPQDLSTVLEYQYTPTGAGFGTGAAGAPAEPTGLTAVPGVAQVAMAWAANAATDNVTGYTLYRAPGAGASFSSAAAIFSGMALSDDDMSVSPSTAYTYFLTAANAAGTSAPTSGVSATTAAASSGGASTTRDTVSTSTLTLGAPPSLTWYVDVANTSGGAIGVILPALPVVGQIVVVTDEGGNAGTDAIAVKSGATTIDTIAVDNGWSSLRWNGANWLRGG